MIIFLYSDDDMISIGSMMSLNDNYNLDDNDDDMEVAPSPRLRHKRNLSSGNVKVPPGMYFSTVDSRYFEHSRKPKTVLDI